MSPEPQVPPIREGVDDRSAGSGGGVDIRTILVTVVAFVVCCGLPVLILMPAMGSAREAARRNGCMNNMRQLALAVQCYESSQKHYPVASRGTTDLLKGQKVGGHGDTPSASDDGFSWLFCMLSGIEETILQNEMKRKRATDPQQTGPFDADFVNPSGQHYASSQVGSFRCPSWSGSMTTLIGDVEAATGNYCAIVGTDLAESGAAPWKTTPNWENGGMPSSCWSTPNSQTAALTERTCFKSGIRLRDMGDGISKTMIAAESREEKYSAWISGASMWVVGTTPNSLAADRVTVGVSPNDKFIAMLSGETVVVEDGDGLALNFGEEAHRPAAEFYLAASDWATGSDRVWGPSSEHGGGIAIHVFADAHAQAIFQEVNPTVYLRFITRSDGDPSDSEDID